MLPSSTLNSCGSSSSDVRRRTAPTGVIAVVALRGLLHGRAVVAARHRAELPDQDLAAVQAVPPLAEEHRARAT